MSIYLKIFIISFLIFIGKVSCQENVVPSGVKFAEVKECGKEVRNDNGILLPILKVPIEYPHWVKDKSEDVLWVNINFDVGIKAIPENIHLDVNASDDVKVYLRKEFMRWRFPHCISNGKVARIENEKILLRISP